MRYVNKKYVINRDELKLIQKHWKMAAKPNETNLALDFLNSAITGRHGLEVSWVDNVRFFAAKKKKKIAKSNNHNIKYK
jgi:hypothetical protein